MAFNKQRAEQTVDWAQGSDWRAQKTGGLANSLPARDFDRDALVRGTVVELEHTSDPLAAMRIAMDHLTELPDYYERLALVEGNPNPLGSVGSHAVLGALVGLVSGGAAGALVTAVTERKAVGRGTAYGAVGGTLAGAAMGALMGRQRTATDTFGAK